MNIYKKPGISIDYIKQRKQLIQKWTGFTSSEIFREAINQTVEFSKTNQVKSIISDTVNQSAVKPDDSAYASSVMPLLIRNGLQAMAFIMPKNVFTQMTLRKFDELTKSDKLNFFLSIEDAQAWINEVTNLHHFSSNL